MRRWGLLKNGLIGDFHSPSPLVRSYVGLFEQISLKLADEPHPMVLVTSPSRGEGRSTLAANLALSCAAVGGRKTLLIDGDFERPGLPRLLQVEPAGGIGRMLQDGADWREAVTTLNDGRVALLGGGTEPGSAFVAARPERLQALVQEWRSTYDWVIADMPPVLTSASVLALGRHATGVLVVTRAGRTRAEVVREAVTLLREANIRVLGAVLNRRRFAIPTYAYRRL